MIATLKAIREADIRPPSVRSLLYTVGDALIDRKILVIFAAA